MRGLQELAYGLRAYTYPVLLLLVSVYALYHLMTGDRGLWAWYHTRSQVSDITHQNTALEKRVAYLEKRVKRLQDNNIDPDFLDEQARQSLAVVRSNENIIFVQQQP